MKPLPLLLPKLMITTWNVVDCNSYNQQQNSLPADFAFRAGKCVPAHVGGRIDHRKCSRSGSLSSAASHAGNVCQKGLDPGISVEQIDQLKVEHFVMNKSEMTLPNNIIQ